MNLATRVVRTFAILHPHIWFLHSELSVADVPSYRFVSLPVNRPDLGFADTFEVRPRRPSGTLSAAPRLQVSYLSVLQAVSR
jgi:hypothetical protein